MPVTLEHLRRFAIARSLFKPTTLKRAIEKLGFVQADPIRAPARAQDLTLRHRVVGYRAGDLERRYPRLPIEEDFFVNYGYVLRHHHGLMHPRTPRAAWSAAREAQARELLEFVRARKTAHPRVVDRHFAHGKITNWFGGSTNATTRLLDEMHYRGLLRVARRDSGTRVYAVREGSLVEAPSRRRAHRRAGGCDRAQVRAAPLAQSRPVDEPPELRCAAMGGSPFAGAQAGGRAPPARAARRYRLVLVRRGVAACLGAGASMIRCAC